MPAGDHARSARSARTRAVAADGHGDRPVSPGRQAGPPATSAMALPGLRGRVRLALIRDLAMGEWSHAELARQLGCAPGDVAQFAEFHAKEVSEVSAALAGQLAIETSGLWVSKRQNRVAELQSLYEDGEQVLEHLRSLSITDGAGLGSRRHATIARTQLAILGAVASEYDGKGKPTSGDDGSNVVHYIIEGPETESLT
jgi:hypothetical protein